MSNDPKEIKNPGYLWIMRIGFWADILITLPLFFIDGYKTGSAMGNALTLLLHCYLGLAGYIMGYRLYNPPKWARWVVPHNWIEEWRYLTYADPDSIKANRNALIRFVGGVIIITILLLALLNGKI